MRSIPLAITWEMLRHGRWVLTLAVLGANALPVLLFTALWHDGVGAIDPEDQSQIIMQMVLVELNMFLFGMAAIAAMAPASRFYTFPVSTSSLVAWTLLLEMAAVAAELVVSTALLNSIFDLRWQLWGPALFGAVTVAAIQAVLWLTEKSGWIGVAMCVVPGGLCIWFKSRYGPTFSLPNHSWSQVTPAEVATLFAVAIASYFVGIFGVARNRCGQPPYSLGLVPWLDERVFAAAPQAGRPFRNPAQAQLWFEWRKKGWAMPASVGMGLFMGLGIWLVANRKANGLVEGFAVGGGLLLLAGLICGCILGNVGQADSDLQVGQFLATRPITNSDLARIILKTAAKSVFVAWVIWTVAFLCLYAILLALGVNLQTALPAELGWWYFPATLVGAWTAVGVIAPIAMAGRPILIATTLFGASVLFCGLVLFSKNVLSVQGQDYFVEGLSVFWGIAFVVWTIWGFAVARRRSLIGWPTLYVALSVWAALCTVVTMVWGSHSTERLPLLVCVEGLLALSVAPLATAPLALAWNRTR
jgi:hypothetical protein